MIEHAAVCSECEWIRRFPRGGTAVATAALDHKEETGHRTFAAEIIATPGTEQSFVIRLGRRAA
jgi:hypothetical protein